MPTITVSLSFFGSFDDEIRQAVIDRFIKVLFKFPTLGVPLRVENIATWFGARDVWHWHNRSDSLMTLTSICVHQHFRLSLHKQNIQGILSRFAIEEMLQNKRNLLETFKFVFSAQTASCSRFVPKHEPVHDRDVEKLSKFLEDKPNILVLTGAGVSTESGDAIVSYAHTCKMSVSIPYSSSILDSIYFRFYSRALSRRINWNHRNSRLSIRRRWTLCT